MDCLTSCAVSITSTAFESAEECSYSYTACLIFATIILSFQATWPGWPVYPYTWKLQTHPVNSTPFKEVSWVTSFITNFTEFHGMPHPSRIPGHRDEVAVLPYDITKEFVFTKYKDVCATNSWIAVWKIQVLQHLARMLATHINFWTIFWSVLCLPEQQRGHSEGWFSSRRREVKASQDHIERARKRGSTTYNSQVSAAQSAWSASEHGNSSPTWGHYSYDFAQQVHFPFNAQ